MSTNNKISNLINSQIPFFVRNDHRTFVTFLEAYYEYLEQTGKAVEVSDKLLDYFDIDKTIDDYADRLIDTYLKDFPEEDYLGDRNLILKNAKDFLRSKGTEKSVRFLMRALFGEEIEFYYPKRDILRASDGQWFIQRALRLKDIKVDGVSNTTFSGLNQFVGTSITGNNSGATATVERADRYYESATLINEVSLSAIVSTFNDGEPLYANYLLANGYVGLVTANVVGGIITTTTIIDGGSGYLVGDQPVITVPAGGGGANAVISVTKVTTGNIQSITIDNGGSGYKIADWLLFTGGGGGSGANANVSNVNTDESVHPNSYNIIISLISDEANSNILNAQPVDSQYETFSYRNLETISTIASNLTISTGSGAATLINLSEWKANSNTWFETFDQLNVGPTSVGTYNVVTILSSNNILEDVDAATQLTIDVPLPANEVANSFTVLKKPNANTTLINALSYFVYDNTGPATAVSVISQGSGYAEIPTVSIIANSRIQQLGILGRMNLVNGGIGYAVSDKIEFYNIDGGYGQGASGNVTSVDGSGTITGIEFEAVDGWQPGGSGYSQSYLPTTNVISSGGGSGANIVVESILGRGATFSFANSTLGTIQKVVILNKGDGYNVAPTLDFTGSGDGTANVLAGIVQGAYSYEGRFLNDDGFLSGYNYLQDRDYYQQFSYVVRVRKSINEYRKILKDLIHPTGHKIFGEHRHDHVVDFGLPTEGFEVGTEHFMSSINTNTTYVYTSTNNTIQINSYQHALNKNANVYIEFTSGQESGNLTNGIFQVSENANGNIFLVIQSSPLSTVTPNLVANGAGYTANSFLIFTGGNGVGANGLFTVNTVTGNVTSVNIADYGIHYNTVPTITANGSNDATAQFNVSLLYGNTNTTGFCNVMTFVH